jgi:hypothetical protein
LPEHCLEQTQAQACLPPAPTVPPRLSAAHLYGLLRGLLHTGRSALGFRKFLGVFLACLFRFVFCLFVSFFPQIRSFWAFSDVLGVRVFFCCSLLPKFLFLFLAVAVFFGQIVFLAAKCYSTGPL